MYMAANRRTRKVPNQVGQVPAASVHAGDQLEAVAMSAPACTPFGRYGRRQTTIILCIVHHSSLHMLFRVLSPQ